MTRSRNRQQQTAAAKSTGETKMSTEQTEQKQELGEQTPPADVTEELAAEQSAQSEDKAGDADLADLEKATESDDGPEDSLEESSQGPTKEQQAELDQAAAAEAERLRVEAELAAQENETKAAQEQLEQQQKDEAQAAALKPTGSALFKVTDSPMVGTLKSQLDIYVATMSPIRITTEAEVNTQQLALHRMINVWLSLESTDDFLGFGDYLLAKVEAERNGGVFDPRFVNRNVQTVRLQPKQRALLSCMTNVLYAVTNKDRALGYSQAGNIQAQLKNVLEEKALLRAVIYFKRFCGVN